MVELEAAITAKRGRRDEDYPLMFLLRPPANDTASPFASIRREITDSPRKANIRESYMVIEIDRIFVNGSAAIPLYSKFHVFSTSTIGSSDVKVTFRPIFAEQAAGYAFEYASNDDY